MNKKEKLASILAIIALCLMIISSFYTIWQLRPDYRFAVEELFNNIQFPSHHTKN